jgi:hypothetical protein
MHLLVAKCNRDGILTRIIIIYPLQIVLDRLNGKMADYEGVETSIKQFKVLK